jgi:hypothetical protein
MLLIQRLQTKKQRHKGHVLFFKKLVNLPEELKILLRCCQDGNEPRKEGNFSTN